MKWPQYLPTEAYKHNGQNESVGNAGNASFSHHNAQIFFQLEVLNMEHNNLITGYQYILKPMGTVSHWVGTLGSFVIAIHFLNFLKGKTDITILIYRGKVNIIYLLTAYLLSSLFKTLRK